MATQRISASDYTFVQLDTETTPMHVGALVFFSGGRETPRAR